MKRILTLGIVCLLCCSLLLAGCGGSGDSSSSAPVSGGENSDSSTPDNSTDTGTSDGSADAGTTDAGTDTTTTVGGGTGAGNQSTTAKSTGAKVTTAATKPPVTGKVELPKFKNVGKEVKYMGWGTGRDFTKKGTDLYELNEQLKKEYGTTIKFVRTTYDELPTDLAQKVMSGDSPDLVHYRYQENPMLILNGLVEEITPNLIDFDTPLWNGIKDVNEEYAFKGKIFTPIVDIINDAYIYYNVQMFEEAGLDSPIEMYRRGEWDWDTFLDVAQQLTQKASDGTVKVYGFGGAPEYFYMNCGEDFVKVNADGTLTNNLNSPTFAKAMNFFYNSGTAGTNCRFMIGNALEMLLNNQLAMYHSEAWEVSQMYDQLKSGQIRIAPSPKMPGADKYYVNSLITTLWIAKDAKNPEGAAAYLSLMRYNAIGSAGAEKAREKMGYTKEEYKIIEEMNDRSKFTFARRIGPGVGNFGNTGMTAMFNEVAYWDWAWSGVVETHTAELQAEIDAYNKKVLAYKG